MEIRSVTVFVESDYPPEKALPFFTEARAAFHVPVQTTRVAMTSFPGWWNRHAPPKTQAQALSAAWGAAGADYVSLGPVQLAREESWLTLLPELLATTDNLFASMEIADTRGRIDVGRCLQAATVIQQVSRIYENGFGNLYLAALANCPPGSPFFPVAYHGGGPAAFALAVQAADLALIAITEADSLAEARHNLVVMIEQEAGQLTKAAKSLSAQHGLTFQGIDFSLAPFPTADQSLAAAMEQLGLSWVGASGSLFAAAFITEAIERANFPRCGFSGLMLPVLEDIVLAQRAAEGRLTITDLLSYSAVCGVGLDTIPLPGDISREQLAAILLDTAALAVRLNKPLTARLMPLPGLQAGDPVTFDFPYFANSRVMAVDGDGVMGLLAQPARIVMQSRTRK